jgi:hypothetical protein
VIAYRTQPPWEFLLTASRNTLQSYELSRLGHAANLRKEISSLLDQWLDENANAMVARWLIEQRERTVLGAESQSASDQPAAEPAPANGHFGFSDFVQRAARPAWTERCAPRSPLHAPSNPLPQRPLRHLATLRSNAPLTSPTYVLDPVYFLEDSVSLLTCGTAIPGCALGLLFSVNSVLNLFFSPKQKAPRSLGALFQFQFSIF